MATYCIGDVHACYDEFMNLLHQIKFDSNKDHIYLTGDVIGRGPKPLETLDFLLKHQNSISTVLGNHDLNLLAVYYGGAQLRERDNIGVVLQSPKVNEYINYLRNRSLLIIDDKNNIAVCHAGIYPLWSLTDAKKRAKVVTKVLRDPLQCKILFTNMYGDLPNKDNDQLSGLALWRFCLNAFTRMRFVYKDGTLDYNTKTKKPSEMSNSNLAAWFKFSQEFKYKKKNYTLIFGHWASLQGECDKSNIKALDTGCIWGGKLSSYCVDTGKMSFVHSKGYKNIAS